MTKEEAFEDLKGYRAVLCVGDDNYFHQPIQPLVIFQLSESDHPFVGNALAILDSEGEPTLKQWGPVLLRPGDAIKISLENALFFGYTIRELFSIQKINWQETGF